MSAANKVQLIENVAAWHTERAEQKWREREPASAERHELIADHFWMRAYRMKRNELV